MLFGGRGVAGWGLVCDKEGLKSNQTQSMLGAQGQWAQTMFDIQVHVGSPYMDHISSNPRNSRCSRKSTFGDGGGDFLKIGN